MDDTAPSPPLTDKALRRLRALAQGNGLDPANLVLMGSEEKIYDFEGITTLTPLFDTKSERYGGPARKGAQMLANSAALQAEVKKREEEFKKSHDWIAAVSTELRREAGEGWGLTGARVELAKRTVRLAATQTCGQCHGRKTIACTRCNGKGYEICYQCRGNKQEICHNCQGTGKNPHAQDQICYICNGNRYAPCRICHGNGQTPCPMCQTRGGTQCPACKGMGQMTEEVHITCGAITSFNFKGEGLPSGLRRGLDRLGIANLAKGHATISFVENKKVEEPKIEEYIPGGLYGVAPPGTVPTQPASIGAGAIEEPYEQKKDEKKPPEPTLHYSARMPFADLRVNFGGRKAVVGVFGLRHIFIDVPPFLDDFLSPALEKLNEAVRGSGNLDKALEIRALREAIDLHLGAKGNLKEFKKLYPVGLSTDLAEKILRGARGTVKRLTLVARSVAAIGGGVLAAGLFGACYFTTLPERFMSGLKWQIETLYFAPPVIAAIFGLLALNFAAYFDLHRHFPEAKIGMRHPTGKTGYAMVIAIVLIWLALLAFSPVRPPWLHPPVH